MIDWSLNLRYLLWKKDIPQEKWVKKITECLNSDNDMRAEDLLRGAKPSDRELDKIKEGIPLSEEEYMGLMNTNIIKLAQTGGDLEIWQENFLFLLTKIPHGKNQDFASKLGFDPSNISKWKNRKQKPEKNKKAAVKKYFGIPLNFDLEEDLLFLSLDPISIQEKKDWICKRINQLNPNAIQELFPAFQRLLRDP